MFDFLVQLKVPAVLLLTVRPAAFLLNTNGGVAVVFGLMLATTVMVAGAAVDVARWLSARDQMISAIDTAVLAGGRYLQTNSDDEAGAIVIARRYYDTAVQGRLALLSDDVQFVVADGGTAVVASGNAQIRTPFMSLAGIAGLPLLNQSGSDAPKAVIASGVTAATNLEIALLLDTSSSMSAASASGGTKLSDMKSAASDLTNILVWDVQSTYTSRLALVPFSGDVRIPAGWLSQVQDPAWPPTRFVALSRTRYSYYKTACVAERAGIDSATDAAPGVGRYIANNYAINRQCAQASPADEVVAMSSDKALLLDKIDKLALGGGAAGHIGAAWGYYVLSPNWASILPSTSVPAAFSSTMTRKFAVIISGSEFDYTHDALGLPTSDTGRSANAASSAAQTIAICNNMKSSGIQIFTVGFELQSAPIAVNTLQAVSAP